MDKYEEVKEKMLTAIAEFELLLTDEPEQVPDEPMGTDSFAETKEEWIDEVQMRMEGFVRVIQ